MASFRATNAKDVCIDYALKGKGLSMVEMFYISKSI